jgi:IclR family acetate operon transcriptional repressor
VTPEPGDEPEPARGGQVQSVARAIALVRCFENGETSLTLTDLARRTGLNVSTAHRILRTLCAGELLAHDAPHERYTQGPAMIRLALVAFAAGGFSEALAVLEELVRETGESASLGIREGDDAVVLLSVQSDAALRFSRPPGSHVPLHVSAMGKALLAFGDTPIPDAVRALGPLRAATKKSLTSARRLERDLKAARARGYTVVDEEQHVGLRSIGAPVLDGRGAARAAVAVQGPVARLSEARFDEIGRAAQRAAAALLLSADHLTAHSSPRVT